MLYGAKGGNTDSFKTSVIDTIVAEVQNVPGEDRCVLLLGYETEMREMFQVRSVPRFLRILFLVLIDASVERQSR